MKKQDQERLLKLLNAKEKLKNKYKEIDKQVLKLAHKMGANSKVIEVNEEMKKNYPELDLEDKKYFRMTLNDNMEIFNINEDEDEEPMVMYRPAKFSRFEIEGKGLKNKPKDFN